MKKLNWNRVYVVLAAVASAMLAACVVLTGEASGRVRASLRSGEEWSERQDRVERLSGLAAEVNDSARAVLWSSRPETERVRMRAGLEAFNAAYAEAVGELRLAPPSVQSNAVLGELNGIDSAMTELVSRAELVFARPSDSAIEEPELHLVMGALSSGFSNLGAQIRVIQDQHVGTRQTAADDRRLAEQGLSAAAAFLILGALFYGGRRKIAFLTSPGCSIALRKASV